MEIQGGVDGLAVHFWPKMLLGLLYAGLSVPRKGWYLSPSTWWISCFCVCCLGDAGSHSIFLVQEGVGSITEPIYGLHFRIPLHMNSQWRNWHLHGYCVPFVPGIDWWISSTWKERKRNKYIHVGCWFCHIFFWSLCSLSILKPCGCNSCLMASCESEIFLRRFVIFCSIDYVGPLTTFLYDEHFTTHGLIKGTLYLFLLYPVKSLCPGMGLLLLFLSCLMNRLLLLCLCPLWKFCLLIFLFTVLE